MFWFIQIAIPREKQAITSRRIKGFLSLWRMNRACWVCFLTTAAKSLCLGWWMISIRMSDFRCKLHMDCSIREFFLKKNFWSFLELKDCFCGNQWTHSHAKTKIACDVIIIVPWECIHWLPLNLKFSTSRKYEWVLHANEDKMKESQTNTLEVFLNGTEFSLNSLRESEKSLRPELGWI